MKRLFELKNVAGVKDATGNLARTALQRDALGPDFIQLSGEDMTALAVLAHGGHGCISVTSNVAPRLCADFQDRRWRRNFKAALAIQDRLTPLHAACSSTPIRRGRNMRFRCSGKIADELRLPMLSASPPAQRRCGRRCSTPACWRQ